MEELLSRDKAKTTLNRISELGLIEMTRKRTRESLGRTDPRALLLLRRHRASCSRSRRSRTRSSGRSGASASNLPGYVIIVNAHPAMIDLLKNDERVAVQEAERLFQRRIDLMPRKEYHLEQFDLQGK
jgi:ribonuclease G